MQTTKRSHPGTRTPEPTELEVRNRAVARKAAADGIVLLKNEGLLPLDPALPVALLGSGASQMIKGGTGSGDVNDREVVSLMQGFQNAGVAVTSENWIQDYDARYRKSRQLWRDTILEKAGGRESPWKFFYAYAGTPYKMPEGRAITEEDVAGAQAAVYVISRVAGEGKDRLVEPGDYLLSDGEKRDLEQLCTLCGRVAVLINSGAPIDLTEILRHPEVKALLFLGQLGMEGGNAAADVLLGKVNPSGHLTDTWAKRYSDFPSHDTFSYHSGLEREDYTEDLYVGYRYFTSFHVKPQYPFGYGLSYTTFAATGGAVTTDGAAVAVEVQVRNTGEVSGRYVAQVYASCPQSGLPKEYTRLCAFAKTKLLRPGETQTMTIRFPVKGLASFHEERSAWVLAQGRYAIWYGSHVEDLTLGGVLAVLTDTVLETVRHICPLQVPLNRLERPRAEALAFEAAWQAEARARHIPDVVLNAQSAAQVSLPEGELDKAAKILTEQLSDETLIRLCIGHVLPGKANQLGSAGTIVPGTAGETAWAAVVEGVPPVSLADGPAGLRVLQRYEVDRENDEVYLPGILGTLERGIFAEQECHENADVYYQYCTSFPVGVSLAQSWDAALVERCGEAIAEEMAALGVTLWLAPGMNLHRNPLCGRNYEYYAEDPVVSGVIAAAMTRGVQRCNGVGVTVKHFACNNQEDNRVGSDSVVSERALRELYLRGFEIAVKTSQPMAIMTSYNLINGVHAANNRDLCSEVARREWGFGGIVMSDWATTGANGSKPAQCIRAGNDLIMPGCQEDYDEIVKAVKTGELSMDDVKTCAARVISLVWKSNAMEHATPYFDRFPNLKPYCQVEFS